MNKKILLGMLALAVAHSAALAQQLRPTRHLIDRAALRHARPVRRSAAAPENGPVRPVNSTTTANRVQAISAASWGQMIGHTTYDLQTNRSSANRLAMTGNALSIVWTQNCDLSNKAFTNRGIGYNYATDANVNVTTPGSADSANFVNLRDGACGTAGSGNFGIATVRTGWPEIVHTNGNEMAIGHTTAIPGVPAASGVAKVTRPIGTGAWSPSTALPFSENITATTLDATPNTDGTWPRVVANGNTVHMIYTANATVPANTDVPPSLPSYIISPMMYNRSTDGGNTWDQTNVTLPGLTDTARVRSIGGDSYAIAVNGSTVAIAAGSFGDNTIIWKSTSNGDPGTFVQYVIQPDWTDADTINILSNLPSDTATVVGSDGSMSLVVDDAGTVHFFTGAQLVRVRRTTPAVGSTGGWRADGTYYINSIRALLYWNDRELATTRLNAHVAPANGLNNADNLELAVAVLDTMCPANPIIPCDELPLPPQTGGQYRAWYGGTGAVSMPTAVVDPTGDVYCIYAGARVGTSNADEEGQFYRDLYLMRLSFPGGGQIQTYANKNISRDIEGIPGGAAAFNTEESVYPNALHRVMNNRIHYTWMSDFEPGTALTPTNALGDDEVDNAIMYDNIDITTLTWTAEAAVTGLKSDVAANGLSASAAPNPTTGKTTLLLNLKQASTATITVRNILGQEVLRLPATALAAGANSVTLDLSNRTAGVYFYTVSTDKFSLTQRVVKQ